MPSGVTSVRVLAVGGGSGGDCGEHGGGASGDVIVQTVSVTAETTYYVTVGSGGEGRRCGQTVAPAGTTSFYGVTAHGGGISGDAYGARGGSGGGAGATN